MLTYDLDSSLRKKSIFTVFFKKKVSVKFILTNLKPISRTKIVLRFLNVSFILQKGTMIDC